MSHAIYRDGKVHVCAERCPTCIFRPGNLMRLQRGRVRQMVDDATADDGCIPCHERLETSSGVAGRDAVCRGFFDLHPTSLLQIAQRLDLVEYDPPVAGSTPEV